jgi:hypothetical protein
MSRGLSSLDDAVDAAIRAQAKRLALFHYDQDYSDHDVDELVARGRRQLDARGAQSWTSSVPPRPDPPPVALLRLFDTEDTEAGEEGDSGSKIRMTNSSSLCSLCFLPSLYPTIR